MKTIEKPLTPALSHPAEEGESFAAGLKRRELEIAEWTALLLKAANCCSLSHRMGEGQGEGRRLDDWNFDSVNYQLSPLN